MSKDNGSTPDQEEFLEIGRTIKYELENIAEFKQYLSHHRKEALILFLILTAEPKQFETILNTLNSLEDLLERENYM